MQIDWGVLLGSVGTIFGIGNGAYALLSQIKRPKITLETPIRRVSFFSVGQQLKINPVSENPKGHFHLINGLNNKTIGVAQVWITNHSARDVQINDILYSKKGDKTTEKPRYVIQDIILDQVKRTVDEKNGKSITIPLLNSLPLPITVKPYATVTGTIFMPYLPNKLFVKKIEKIDIYLVPQLSNQVQH